MDRVTDVSSANADQCLLIGCPRSGTFLLMAILEQCFNAATPVETHFIPLFQRYLPLWGDLSKRRNRARLLEAIYDFLDIWTPRMIVDGDMSLAWRYSLGCTRPDAEAILDSSTGYADLVAGLFDAYRRRHDKDFWVDKSAFYRHLDLRFIEDVLPRARVIHIVRDGRDCALSWMATWATPGSLDESARLWAEHVEKKADWIAKNPKRGLEIRYEDLIADPTASLERIGVFLGRAPSETDPDLSESEYASVLGKLESHRLVAGAIRPGNEKKYLRYMGSDELSLFSFHAGRALTRFGYDLVEEAERPPCFQRILNDWRSMVSVNALRRAVKTNLPLLIFISRQIGIDLARLVNRRGNAKEWPTGSAPGSRLS